MQGVAYKCLDCGEEFTEPRTETDWYDPNPNVPGYTLKADTTSYCPHCGSEWFEEGYLCEACEERFTESTYCPSCIQKVADAVSDVQYEIGCSWKSVIDLVYEWVGNAE